MPADQSKYVISINVNVEEASKQKKALDKTNGKKKPGTQAKGKDKSEEALSEFAEPRKIKGATYLAFAKRSVNRVASTALGSIGTRLGDEALQNRIDNIVGVAGNAINNATSVLVASALNPILGVMEVASMALDMAINSYQRSVDFAEQRLEDTRAIQRRSERLGVVSYGRGRKNN